MNKTVKKEVVILLVVVISHFCGNAQNVVYPTDFGVIFDTVQKAGIFADQKKFVDLTPQHNQSPAQILEKYNEAKSHENFDLRSFVAANFDTVLLDTSDVINHINHLWKYLTRYPDNDRQPSTLIPLKHPYIVPGGRFREIYYWDSYFTMLGLEVAKETEIIKNMLDNFAYLIDEYGHIPNGNRTYYLSRSQPPFFSLMIELYANLPQTNKSLVYKEYQNVLKKEYDFWMQHTKTLNEKHKAEKRVVHVSDNCLLNRYWDNRDTPRPESYLQDIETKNNAKQGEEIYRNIRAAAESGWDFSSRWLSNKHTLSSIQTTHIIPIDLNCLLYHQELVLSKMYDNKQAEKFKKAAEKRKANIIEIFWDEKRNFFFDYDFTKNKHTTTRSLAALYPLFFNIADTAIARKIAKATEQRFLKDGGLVTTLNNTGQQWDAPNGWPPLQWIGYKAMKNYGYDKLAKKIARRWISLNVKVFFETNKMMEKYDVEDINRKGGGGEYELQDGFGWTNGVFLKLWEELH